MQLRPLGGLRPFCVLAAALTVAVWPAAAAAQLDSGRSTSAERSSTASAAPKLWAVEIDRYAAPFLRPAYLARMRNSGVNAIVVDPLRLTAKQLRAAIRAARGAKLQVIGVVPPARARVSGSVKAVRAACRAAKRPAGTRCASRVASVSGAMTLSRRGRRGALAVVRLKGPAQLAGLKSAGAAGSEIVALPTLTASPSFDAAAWEEAIATAATSSSVDLAVQPSGSSKQRALNAYLSLLAQTTSTAGGPDGPDGPDTSPPSVP